MSQNEKSGAELLGKAIEAFADAARQLHEKESARRAAMTPSQRAAEDGVRNRAEASKQAAKAEKERQRLQGLCKEWWSHDTWDVDSEAIPLALGLDPKTALPFLPPMADRIRELVKRADGPFLTLYPATSIFGGKRVRPAEFVRFLVEKGEQVPDPMRALVTPQGETAARGQDATGVPKLRTAAANATREEQKRDRKKALQEFKAETDRRAKKRGQNIDWSALSVTKKDFLAVFFHANPGLAKRFGRSSFNNDFGELGIKFRRGVKHKLNNMLTTVWHPVKEG
jgi:hypothetical protein